MKLIQKHRELYENSLKICNFFEKSSRFEINKRDRSKTLGIALSKLLWKCGEANNEAFVCV